MKQFCIRHKSEYSQMKIAIAHPEFSRRKGIERAFTELACGLQQRGHEVHVHTNRKFDEPGTLGICFHHVRVMKFVTSAMIFSFPFSAKYSLAGQVYDITHSMGAVVGCDILTAQSCHKAGLKVAMKMDGNRVKAQRNYGIADRLRLQIESLNYSGRRFRKIISVSQGVKRELIETYGVHENDIHVIPNGVDVDAFHPDLKLQYRNLVRSELGLSNDDFVMIFVGNEFERKGLEYIIEAIAILRNPKIKVIVAGGDDKTSFVERARNVGVDEKFVFLGNSSQLAKFYAASDAFIFPTFYEAFSLASLEAAASGLPLLVTKVNGTEELVEDAVNGYFIKRDGVDIAAKVNFLFNNPNHVIELAHHARTSSLSYSWDRNVERTIQVYEKVIRMKRSN